VSDAAAQKQEFEPPPGGRDNIVRAMGGTAHAMRRHLDHHMHEVPGRTSAWAVMRHLSHCGSTTQADLARAVGVAGSTLTRRLEQMENDGLIERTDDPDDGRRIIVTLSERGRILRDEQRERSRTEIESLVAGAEPADIEAMWRVFGVIRSNLDELNPEGEGPGGPGRRGGRGRGQGGGPGDGRGRGRGPGGGRGRHEARHGRGPVAE